MGDYLQAERKAGNSSGDTGVAGRVRSDDAGAGSAPATREARTGSRSPRTQALLQLRETLDNSPRAQSQLALQRALDRSKRPAEVRPVEQKRNTTGLPDRLKAGVEQLSGLSMDDVRVHYNSARPAAVQALAYTQGGDIHVAPGQEQHLPHESWHVVQQKQGRVTPTLRMNGVAINDERLLEDEADRHSRIIARLPAPAPTDASPVSHPGSQGYVLPGSGATVQRMLKNKNLNNNNSNNPGNNNSGLIPYNYNNNNNNNNTTNASSTVLSYTYNNNNNNIQPSLSMSLSESSPTNTNLTSSSTYPVLMPMPVNSPLTSLNTHRGVNPYMNYGKSNNFNNANNNPISTSSSPFFTPSSKINDYPSNKRKLGSDNFNNTSNNNTNNNTSNNNNTIPINSSFFTPSNKSKSSSNNFNNTNNNTIPINSSPFFTPSRKIKYTPSNKSRSSSNSFNNTNNNNTNSYSSDSDINSYSSDGDNANSDSLDSSSTTSSSSSSSSLIELSKEDYYRSNSLSNNNNNNNNSNVASTKTQNSSTPPALDKAYRTWDRAARKKEAVVVQTDYGPVRAKHKRGAPHITSKDKDYNNASLRFDKTDPRDKGDSYKHFVHGLKGGAGGDSAIARSLLNRDATSLTQKQKRAAAMLQATVYLAERWRKEKAHKLFRYHLKQVDQGKVTLEQAINDFTFAQQDGGTEQGRKQLGRIDDLRHSKNKETMRKKASKSDLQIADQISDGESSTDDELLRKKKEDDVKSKQRLFSEKHDKSEKRRLAEYRREKRIAKKRSANNNNNNSISSSKTTSKVAPPSSLLSSTTNAKPGLAKPTLTSQIPKVIQSPSASLNNNNNTTQPNKTNNTSSIRNTFMAGWFNTYKPQPPLLQSSSSSASNVNNQNLVYQQQGKSNSSSSSISKKTTMPVGSTSRFNMNNNSTSSSTQPPSTALVNDPNNINNPSNPFLSNMPSLTGSSSQSNNAQASINQQGVRQFQAHSQNSSAQKNSSTNNSKKEKEKD
jgi:hypothetical protein